MSFKQEIIKIIKKEVSLSSSQIDSLLEIPPDSKMGDFAFPCFSLSKELKKAPNIIADNLSKNIKPKSPITEVKAIGPYLNFFIDKNLLASSVLKEIIKSKSCFGSLPSNNKTIVIEYPAPNTNKPLHLGHVRNMLLGSTICNILAFAGFKTVPVDLVNDRGIHICKSLLAYQKWGENKQPDKKSDHFVGDYYVMFNNKVKDFPELEDEAKELLKKWESGDKETLALWDKMRKWALDGFKQTYELFDVHHKKTYYESEIYKQGKNIIDEGLKKKVFYRNKDGAVVVNLKEFKLGEKVLLRADGTSVYITQDLFLAKKKFDDFKADKSVYVVGNEQDYHFKVLFKVLELLNLSFAKNCYHLSYGMVNLPDGRMKSREGTIVDADNLAFEIKELAKKEIIKRHEGLSEKEVDKRADIIWMGALKFFILKYDPAKDFIYNPKESISFEGETGPYIQYAHARICSILRNEKKFNPEKIKANYSNEKEFRLITLLSNFKRAVEETANNYKPSMITRYALELAQAFNEFYQECPVLKEKGKVKDSRLLLIFCVKQVISNALDLLGIKSPEEM